MFSFRTKANNFRKHRQFSAFSLVVVYLFLWDSLVAKVLNSRLENDTINVEKLREIVKNYPGLCDWSDGYKTAIKEEQIMDWS